MKRYILLLLSVIWGQALLAQQSNVTLRCETENAVGKRVELFSYSDPLAMNEVLEDETEVDEEGRFTLRMYANYPRLVVVQIENFSQSFYVEPGRVYEMRLPEFDWSIDERQNINLAPVALPFVFDNLQREELNLSIGRFDEVVDSFVYANRIHFDFKFRPDKSYFDTLLQVVAAECPDTENEYFNRYKRYRLAALRCELRFASRSKLYDELVRDQTIRYYDDNYMHFFLTLYRNSISKGNRYLTQRQVAEFVERMETTNFLDSLGLDPLLRNEQVRELAALQSLSEAYYRSYYFRGERVMKMIADIGSRSKFKEHKLLAENLLEKFRREEPTAVMPDFALPDVEKNKVRLKDYRGRWIYLSFVRAADPACMAELETMAHFHDSVCADSNVVFITVDCDREFQKMYHLLKNSRRGSRYNWTWLHFDGDYRMLEQYGVASYPTFILLNPKGEKQYSVTPAPATGFLTRGPWRQANAEREKPRFFLNEY